MASERLIKRRIRSAKNISQITKAMQMVAASKMKKAQHAALAGRPYAEKIAEMVSKFTAKIDPSKHPLLSVNSDGKSLIILISTNKGLAGGLNTNLFRAVSREFSAEQLLLSVFVTMGKKGENFVIRTRKTLLADFSVQTPFSKFIPSLTTYITDGYTKKEFKEVYLVYNNFISALKQEPIVKKLLPISEFKYGIVENDESIEENREFLVEPSIDEILDELLFHYAENQVRDAILEAEASEHSARMIAMKSATDNARDLTNLLTQEYNKARQEKITFEIADMVTARSAVSA